MSVWDILFWAWFIAAAFLLVYSTIEEYSLLTVIFAFNLIGFGFLKLSQERSRKVSRRLLEKLKSI